EDRARAHEGVPRLLRAAGEDGGGSRARLARKGVTSVVTCGSKSIRVEVKDERFNRRRVSRQGDRRVGPRAVDAADDRAGDRARGRGRRRSRRGRPGQAAPDPPSRGGRRCRRRVVGWADRPVVPGPAARRRHRRCSGRRGGRVLRRRRQRPVHEGPRPEAGAGRRGADRAREQDDAGQGPAGDQQLRRRGHADLAGQRVGRASTRGARRPFGGCRLKVPPTRETVRALMPDLAADLGALVSITSVSAPGFPVETQPALLAAYDAVAQLLREAGAEQLAPLELPGTAPILTGAIEAPAGAPTVLLYSHYDVVGAGDAASWSSPPFEATVRGGAIYGRGAADSKANVLVHVGALRAWGGRPPVGVRLLIEGQEEVGSPLEEGYPAAHPDRFAADAIVVADGGSIRAGQPSLTVSL